MDELSEALIFLRVLPTASISSKNEGVFLDLSSSSSQFWGHEIPWGLWPCHDLTSTSGSDTAGMLTDRVAGFYLMIFNESILCEMTQCPRQDEDSLLGGGPFFCVIQTKLDFFFFRNHEFWLILWGKTSWSRPTENAKPLRSFLIV